MFKQFHPSLIRFAALLCLCTFATAEDIVKVGAGSYATKLPDGAKTAPAEIFRTANVKGPMPTNDWWSSLAWMKFSEAMFPHPLAVKAEPGGLRVAYPGAGMTANKSAIFAGMAGDGADFTIGHSAVEKFADARVDGFSDCFVTALFADGAKTLRTTFGHGSPCVFATIEGGDVTLTFGKDAPTVWAGTAKDAVLGISVKNRHYGIFAPSGSSWSDLTQAKWTCDARGKGYFTVAVLPDAEPKTLASFAHWAYNHVTGSTVEWSYDEKTATVTTKFTFTTKRYEGQGQPCTFFALYPHQHAQKGVTLDEGKTYASVRGPMKLGAGVSFTTETVFPGVLPSLPLTAKADKTKLDGFIAEELKDKGKLVADTYWLGKEVGKWATLIPLVEQTGNKTAVDELTARVKASLENFFTATDAAGAPKKGDAGLFFYDANWGTLTGYPASYGSDVELNDHHFHYGYFIRAAGEIARRDSAWAAKWGPMVKVLIRDIASTDRQDPMFPFLRNFDPYAGHTWASGHAKFGDGNNNESSSEAVNAWYGLILWGIATGDRELRDLGVWLFTTEVAAINAYWFDATDEFHPKDYTPSVVTMIWGGKGANGTWFSGNPELIHGINWLPFSGASLYLGRYPDYCAKNYAALVAENLEDDTKKAAKDGGKTIPGDGTNWDQWADILWMYRALSDPADALKQFDARPAGYKPEGGNSLANVYAWLTTLEALGQVDRTITADAPYYAVFSNAGKRRHVAWNPDAQPRTVTFSDGTTVQCEAGAPGVK